MNWLTNCSCADKWGDWGLLILRLSVGFIFLTHGWNKVQTGLEGVSGFLGGLGFPLPEVMAALLITGELFAGVGIILGFLTHWAAKVGGFIALVALLVVHLSQGYSAADGGFEYVLLLVAAAVVIMIFGGGKWTLDRVLWKKRESAPSSLV